MTAALVYPPELPNLELPAVRELASVDQWVCWRYQGKPNSKGKRPKVPCEPNGQMASSSAPDTWHSFEACSAAFVAGGFEGIGFVFSSEDDFCGVDFDEILGPDGCITNPEVASWLRELGTYAEVSPSGVGLKAFCKGSIPSSLGSNASDPYEMYEQGRFFTLTGRHFVGTPDSINWAQEPLSALHRSIRAKRALVKPTPSATGVDRHADWSTGRHDKLRDAAMRMAKKGMHGEDLLAYVVGLDLQRCDPPKQDIPEFQRIVAWVDEQTGDHDDQPIVESIPGYLSAIFTGQRLTDLAKRPTPPPIHPMHTPRGHLTGVVGQSFVGKTTAQLWGAMARAAGVPLWAGAPECEPSSTLIYSPDEPVEQIARQIRRLALCHPGGRNFDYSERIHVLGLDSTVDADLLGGLRLDHDGLARWDHLLAELRPQTVVIDAYGDVLPEGVSENDNDHARSIGGGLEALAVKYNTAFTVLHHVKKLGVGIKSDDLDVRDLGRGASAFAQKCRAVFSFEEVSGQNHLRRTRTRTNLCRTPAPLELEVCDIGLSSPEIVYFKVHDPLMHYTPSTFLKDDEWVSTTELARRLDRAINGKDDREPPGPVKTLAGELRRAWNQAGLISVREGSRKSKEICLGSGS